MMRAATIIRIAGWVLAGLLATQALGAVRYVDPGSVTQVYPYTNWSQAVHEIQAAINASTNGDVVVVTNGVYDIGGSATWSARVAVDRAITVRSLNGPEVTIIRGKKDPAQPHGPNSTRCAYVTNGAVLQGFTLTGGDAGYFGGGVRCDYIGAVVSNCVISGNGTAEYGGGTYQGSYYNCIIARNTSVQNGGGAFYGTFYNCLLTGNSADYGGGAYYAALTNCTVTGNFGFQGGGGIFQSAAYNSIVCYNTGLFAETNYDAGSVLNYCCALPKPASGTGNIGADPQLANGAFPAFASPCRGAGGPVAGPGTDLSGLPYGSPPSMGCYEYVPGAVTGALGVAIVPKFNGVTVGYAWDLQAQITGKVVTSVLNFGDGVIVLNQPWSSHVWNAPGSYPVVLTAYNESNPGGVSATTTVNVVTAPVHYVSAASQNPAPPYTSWATAAADIQSAVDVAVAGATVIVSNGVYATGGRPVANTMLTNRVAVERPIRLVSVNGPGVTVIQGRSALANGAVAARCVYLNAGAALSGFMLTNGSTSTLWPGNADGDWSGGGVWCEPGHAAISNCVVFGNFAYFNGGGIAYGKVDNCIIRSNRTDYSMPWVINALRGGGAYESTLANCVLIDNYAQCGGGAYGGELRNCTVVGNGSFAGGGVGDSLVKNCIVYSNYCYFTNIWANYYSNYTSTVMDHCCTLPLPAAGAGNFTNWPAFASFSGRNLRLLSNSPCINSGNNAFAVGMIDLDGRPRIAGGTVDLGAYEYQPSAPGAFISWLEQNHLPVDGSADYGDADSDGFNNWQEFSAGTNPTNGASVLRISSVARGVSGPGITWQSVAGKT